MKTNKRKVGRPTDIVKPTRLGVRLDTDTLAELDVFCTENNLSRSEVIRRAIKEYIGK